MSLKRTYNDEELQVLANELTRANTHIYFARNLRLNYEQLGAPNDFWKYTLDAHSSIALLNLCRVYDTHNDGINLFNCLESIDKNALDQAKQTQLNTYIALCRPQSENHLVKSLRAWRNKIIAHYNIEAALNREGFDKKNPDEPEEILRNLIETGFKILEWCSSLHGKVTTYQKFAPGKASYKDVLECLQICKKLKHE